MQEIYLVLSTFNLFHLKHFHYYLGYRLFESFFVLLHFLYNSTEIREGIVNHF